MADGPPFDHLFGEMIPVIYSGKTDHRLAAGWPPRLAERLAAGPAGRNFFDLFFESFFLFFLRVFALGFHG